MSFRRAKITQQHVLSLPAPVSVGMSCASSGPPSPIKTLPTVGVWKREESYIQETPQTQQLEDEGLLTRQPSALADPVRSLRATSVRYSDAEARASRSNSAAWRSRAASSPRTGSASLYANANKPMQVSSVDLVVHGWNGRVPPGRVLPPVRRDDAPPKRANHPSFRPRTPSAGPGSSSGSGSGPTENKHERVAIGGVINPGGQVPCIWLEKPKTNLVDLDEFPFYEMRVRQPTLTKVYTPKALGSFDVMQALSGRPTALEAELRYYYEAFKRHDMSNLPRVKCRTLPASRSFTFTN